MTILSKVLEKYYNRKGNRLIFSNGKTLNQLAWEMWERLGYKEIDPSVLSRVLKGERLFTFKQLKAFSQILSLTNSQYLELDVSRNADLEKKFGFSNYSSFVADKQFITLIKKNLEKITEFNFLGRFGLMGDWIGSLREVVDDKITRTFNRKLIKEMLYFKALILIEQNHLLVTYKYRTKIPRKVLENGCEIVRLAKELKKPDLLGSANMNMGDAFFVSGQYEDASKYLFESIPYFTGESRGIAAGWSPLRTLALCLAYTNKNREYADIKRRLILETDCQDLGFQIVNYDALTRAEAILKNYKRAQEYLDKCYDIYEKIRMNNGKYKELIPIMLTRTELELEKQRNFFSKSYLERRGVEALEKSNSNGYGRYNVLIKNLLSDVLN